MAEVVASALVRDVLERAGVAAVTGDRQVEGPTPGQASDQRLQSQGHPERASTRTWGCENGDLGKNVCGSIVF